TRPAGPRTPSTRARVRNAAQRSSAGAADLRRCRCARRPCLASLRVDVRTGGAARPVRLRSYRRGLREPHFTEAPDVTSFETTPLPGYSDLSCPLGPHPP